MHSDCNYETNADVRSLDGMLATRETISRIRKDTMAVCQDPLDSNLRYPAIANYLVIRPSVSHVIRIIVEASAEINLYQFTPAMPRIRTDAVELVFFTAIKVPPRIR